MPLRGIRVLDFTRHVPGPYATDLLRHLGAEVIKVEPPEGDPTRWLPPFVGEDGALFALLNSGKKSVAVDLRSEDGRAFVHALAQSCDVAIESYRPGMARELGIDAETLRTINPRLICCSLSGYGAKNPRSGHDLGFVALAGLLDLQRDAAGDPVLPSAQIGDIGGALFATISILAALIERQRSGVGKTIDISMADATRSLMPAVEALYRGEHESQQSFVLTGGFPGYGIYRTLDGKHLSVAALEPRFWVLFCEAIGHPELVGKHLDASAFAEMRQTIAATISTRTRAEWGEIFETVDACVEPVLSIDDAHARFGDPSDRHPLEVNFPSANATPQTLGASFDEVAEIAGIRGDELRAMRGSGTFKPRGLLKKLMLRAHVKFRGR